MANSYQNEIPPARVNITLDVETAGAKKKKELPLKLLALGNFSRGNTSGKVSDRERISISKENFNQVLQDLGPRINTSIDNTIKKDGSELGVELSFKDIKDFHPEKIAGQIPELRNLLAMRNILKDLKANLLDKEAFRKELGSILKTEYGVKQLIEELKQIAPEGN